jgi:hypothetical protein
MSGPMLGPMIGPWRRAELAWAGATASVSAVLFAFSDASMGWLERLPLLFFLAATGVLLAMPWLRRRFGDGNDRVSFDDQGIDRTGAGGAREHIDWDDLATVAVVAGGADRVTEPPYWLFLDESGRGGCAIPADADGIEPLLERVRALAGFERGLETRALAANNQQRFVLWRRQRRRR